MGGGFRLGCRGVRNQEPPCRPQVGARILSLRDPFVTSSWGFKGSGGQVPALGYARSPIWVKKAFKLQALLVFAAQSKQILPAFLLEPIPDTYFGRVGTPASWEGDFSRKSSHFRPVEALGLYGEGWQKQRGIPPAASAQKQQPATLHSKPSNLKPKPL